MCLQRVDFHTSMTLSPCHQLEGLHGTLSLLAFQGCQDLAWSFDTVISVIFENPCSTTTSAWDASTKRQSKT